MTLDEIVRDEIDNLGIGLTKGTNLFGPEMGEGPGVPTNAVFVTLGGGLAPQRASGGDEVQAGIINVLVHWNVYQDGLDKAQALRDGLQGTTPTGTLDIVGTESFPSYIGQAQAGYHRFSLGFRVTRNG